MHRRHWLISILCSLSHFVLLACCRIAPAQQPQTANLAETLRSVLKCRRPEEFAFVDLVASKVAQGALPLEMVLSMMKWARQRREDIPFPYFQEGIRRRAAAIGVDL
jgi:hypothetical protein